VDILIDKTVPYQNVISLMDSVRDGGFPRFSLLTLSPARSGT
jgi:biopolymer transport protein ExbD